MDGQHLPNVPLVNPITLMSEGQEAAMFASICGSLNRACESAVQALPIARTKFDRSAEIAEDKRLPQEEQRILRNLIFRCGACLDASESLRRSLGRMQAKDTSGAGRNDRTFWQLTKAFTQSFIDLVAEMKEAKNKRLLPQDIIPILRPVQKASREAVSRVDVSPWALLAEAGAQPLVRPLLSANGDMNGILGNNSPHFPPGFTNGFHPPLPQHQHWPLGSQNGLTHVPTPSSIPAAMQGSSPSSLALPATPLSAALGPAAQATIPSTPASAYGDSFFRGDVFARADALLNMQPQNGGLTFNSRR